MLDAGGHDVDSGGVDGAVPQDIRQLGDILVDAVEGAGKELAQVMGKHLGALHTGGHAKLFHHPPDAAAVQRFSSFSRLRSSPS